jgi:5,6-dimethylbenzimidazole synthase
MISDSDSDGNYNTNNSSFSSNEKEVLYKAIFSRRDVRSHFIQGRVIPNDVLLRILTAAHHAPSVGFSQPWNFILIKDKSIRAQVKNLS